MACWSRNRRLWGWTQLFLKVCACHFFSWPPSKLSVRLYFQRVLVRVTVLIPSSSLILVSRGEWGDLEWWLIIFALLVWVMTSLMCFGREGAQQGVNATFSFWQHSIAYKTSCVLLKHCSYFIATYLHSSSDWLICRCISRSTRRWQCVTQCLSFFLLCVVVVFFFQL